jgi:hypothetical protein
MRKIVQKNEVSIMKLSARRGIECKKFNIMKRKESLNSNDQQYQ